MKLLNVAQGSPEWKALRVRYRVASEAPIIMGASSKVKRNELLHMKKTLNEREFSDWVQINILDKGHEYEADCRPLIEAETGDELYPVVAADDSDIYLASFDGMPMSEAFTWEHKQWNEELAELVRKQELDPEWYWQLEHQLMVSGAPKVLFTVSDGTAERKVSMWYSPVAGRREQLVRGWDQFMEDLEKYVPVEERAPVVARPVTDLPAVMVQVKGSIDVADNFKLFETALRDFIDNRLIRQPKTDQDFADLDLQIKALVKAEDALQSAEAQMLAQVSSIDGVKRVKDMLYKLARDNRLAAEKLLEAEKKNRRNQIVQGGQTAWTEHVANINKTLGGKIVLPAIQANFAEVIKNKRTISSLQDAVDTELARVKIEANRIADGVRINLQTLKVGAAGYEFLFNDAQQLVMKANDDLVSVIKVRIADHKEAERKKEEEQRARIQKEEQEKAEKKPEPQPVVQEQPAPIQQPVPPARASRRHIPTSKEIVDVLAAHYKVDRSTVIGWIKNFDSIAA
jgi:predicted phage-related endonuclease